MNPRPKPAAKASIMWLGNFGLSESAYDEKDIQVAILPVPKGFTCAKLRAIDRLVNMTEEEIILLAIDAWNRADSVQSILETLGLIAKKGKK